MKRKYSILTISPPRGMRREEGVRAIILYFLLIVVVLGSETSRSASNVINNGRAVLYRSGFDDAGAEISHHLLFQ